MLNESTETEQKILGELFEALMYRKRLPEDHSYIQALLRKHTLQDSLSIVSSTIHTDSVLTKVKVLASRGYS